MCRLTIWLRRRVAPEIREAVGFTARAPTNGIPEFQKKQIARFWALKREIPVLKKWRECAPPRPFFRGRQLTTLLRRAFCFSALDFGAALGGETCLRFPRHGHIISKGGLPCRYHGQTGHFTS